MVDGPEWTCPRHDCIYAIVSVPRVTEQAAGIQFEVVGWTGCLHGVVMEYLQRTIGSAPLTSDWLEQHPTTFIRSKERLDAK